MGNGRGAGGGGRHSRDAHDCRGHPVPNTAHAGARADNLPRVRRTPGVAHTASPAVVLEARGWHRQDSAKYHPPAEQRQKPSSDRELVPHHQPSVRVRTPACWSRLNVHRCAPCLLLRSWEGGFSLPFGSPGEKAIFILSQYTRETVRKSLRKPSQERKRGEHEARPHHFHAFLQAFLPHGSMARISLRISWVGDVPNSDCMCRIAANLLGFLDTLSVPACCTEHKASSTLLHLPFVEAKGQER